MYEARPRERCRASIAVSFKELCRLSPLAFTHALIDAGLLEQLNGQPCPRAAGGQCSDNRPFKVADGGPVLGKLVEAARDDDDDAGEIGADVTRRSVHYRCKLCRTIVAVDWASPLYDAGGGGRASITDVTLCFWLCTNDVSLTHAVLQAGLGEDACRTYYATARAVMAWKAIQLQSQLKLGEVGDRTTEVEADEHVFKSWSASVAGDQGVDTMHYFWYCIVGIIQRGDPTKLLLEPMGINLSKGEPRPPPLSRDRWADIASRAFSADRPCILHTDGAKAYEGLLPGVVQHHSVNHSAVPMELTKPVVMLSNVATRELVPGVCGTQLIDSEWGRLEAQLPKQLSGRTADTRDVLDSYLRAAQWRRMQGNRDLWAALCAATCATTCEVAALGLRRNHSPYQRLRSQGLGGLGLLGRRLSGGCD